MKIETKTDIAVMPAGALFMSVHAGSAKDDENNLSFQLMQSVSGEPMIKCVETGKTAVFNWQFLMEIAVAAGITVADKPVKKDEPKKEAPKAEAGEEE